MSSQTEKCRILESPTLAGSEADPALQLAAAERRVQELESRLAGQARARAELVHLVSHELRTPITVISGFTRLLQNENHGALNAEQHRFAGEILRSCVRLDDFVHDLLEARSEADTPFVVEAREGDLLETLTSQFESLAPLLDERGMKVEARFHAETERWSHDERRIGQVLTNLMTNAIRYGRPAGLIRVATEIVPAGKRRSPEDAIEISVEDDGPGILEADRERLFQPYVRGEGVEADTGLGIGLAICRRIVQAHGGRIRVESSELGGARFVFSLPRASRANGED